MTKKLYRVLRGTLRLYLDKQIPRSAAAMSYYLTMSLFPLLICLYTLLGSSYGKMLQVVELADSFMSQEATQYLKSFLLYIASNPHPALLLSGLAVLLSSASAAVRVMQMGLREIRGENSWSKGWRGWLMSFLISLAFVAVLYFGILVMLTGQAFLEMLERIVPVLSISQAWTWLRFAVLGCLVLMTVWGTFQLSGRKKHLKRYTFPGALSATLGIVLMSWIFSGFIAVSSRYSLVYGSLASVILLMFWLFLCSQMIFLGAAVNQAVLDAGVGPKNQD